MSDHDNQPTSGSPADATPDATPAPAQAAPTQTVIVRRGGAGTVIAAVFLSVLASGAAVVTAPFWQPAVSRLAALPDPVRRLAADHTSLARAHGDLEQRVAALTEQVGTLSGTVQGNTASVTNLRTATLALTVGELRNALRRDDPFEVELAAVRAAAGDDGDVIAAIDELAPFAAAGAASRSDVRRTFATAAATAVHAALEAQPAAEDADGWQVSMASMTSMLTQFRYFVRLDTPPTDSPYAVAQRARTALAADDLAGAVAEFGSLPTAGEPTAAEWLSAARARVAADRAAATLASLMLSRTTAK